MLFANHNLAFRNLLTYSEDSGGNFHSVNPVFSKTLVDSECSMKTTFESNGGNITWTP
jgi:hypothetical protein